jgi:ArsR family transcriptional regulator
MAQRERTVEELARLSGMSVANTSRHLQSLRSARLVVVRRAGLHAHYRLADGGVFELWRVVRDLGEKRLATVRELVSGRFERGVARERVGIEELAERMGSGSTVVLDARPEDEFLAGHIAGAVNVPADEVEAHLHVLPMDQEVVVYCRGPYCGFADRAVGTLRAHGYRARRLALGFPDWRAAGLPVAAG